MLHRLREQDGPFLELPLNMPKKLHGLRKGKTYYATTLCKRVTVYHEIRVSSATNTPFVDAY